MNRCKGMLMIAVAALGFASAARSQVAVYAGATGERITGIQCQDTLNRCASNDGTSRPYGVNFGAFYDFRDYGFMRVGADVRGSVLNTNKSASQYQGGAGINRHYAFLGGVRGTFQTRYTFIRPYVQASFGYARTNAVSNSYDTFAQVQAFAGVDVPLGGVVDLRAIELGAGSLFGPSTHGIQSIGIGLVFHGSRSQR